MAPSFSQSRRRFLSVELAHLEGMHRSSAATAIVSRLRCTCGDRPYCCEHSITDGRHGGLLDTACLSVQLLGALSAPYTSCSRAESDCRVYHDFVPGQYRSKSPPHSLGALLLFRGSSGAARWRYAGGRAAVAGCQLEL